MTTRTATRTATRMATRMIVAIVAFGAVAVPCSAVLGMNGTASPSDPLTADLLVGRVEERSPIDSGAAVFAFGLLCAGAAFAGARRVWLIDDQELDDEFFVSAD